MNRLLGRTLLCVVTFAMILVGGCESSGSGRKADATDSDATVVSGSCTDGFQNGTEEGTDCGGDCPNECTTDPSCTDGVQNGTEAGIDCGGACSKACATTPTCTDGTKNGTEAGIDCGGSCPKACPTCSDSIQNGSEEGVDCGGSCPNACVPPRVYAALKDGSVYSYPSFDSLFGAKDREMVGENNALKNNLDVFVYDGLIYRVDAGGSIFSYPDIASLVSGNGTAHGTNGELTDYVDLIVGPNNSGQTWIYGITPECGKYSYESIKELAGDGQHSYHGAPDRSCAGNSEFFMTTMEDKGADSFYGASDDGTIYYFTPAKSPMDGSWSDDFSYGTPDQVVGTNADLGSNCVGVFVF